MTREEAIKMLCGMKAENLNLANLYTRDRYDALDMAIKSLDQPCEDAVSRQSMLDAITEIDDNTNMDIYTNEVREIIRDLPSVTPTRKKGKWLLNKDGISYCSECKSLQYGGHYCANCGAEMESEE